ncbi:SDR family NAD(P)-dependent oxidoreductase [Bacillus massilinigeriensis]|uniref:SDR family NAD(P)-dependent oxidoreductase n=1 Tax=Bacillus mediterraneensis TaxID=1805474 RepID=UPI0008F86980|nr:SDR family NAD(P)-dependent oxidoreductase [Bacillus mediterraneensis]
MHQVIGKLDFLFNNAHVSRQVPITQTYIDDFYLSFYTGFYPTVYLMQTSNSQSKQNKGLFIHFASGTGIIGQVNPASYASAKEAIRGLTSTVFRQTIMVVGGFIK